MQIKVLQHHIDEGKRKLADFCPIALAVKEQLGKGWVTVGRDRIHMYDDRDRMVNPETRPLPEAAQMFVADFDHGRPVEPLVFDLV